MENRFLSFKDVSINNGFWKEKQATNTNVTVHAIYQQFKKSGRFDAASLNWKEGDSDKPHIFWDSDIAKWIESASYVIEKNKNTELQNLIDEIVEIIGEKQEDCGYYNIWFKLFEPQNRFTRRTEHELYCAGHLIEAAIAYYNATKKDKFLKIMCKYADYIEKVFYIEKTSAPTYITPGHPEIELALVRLYETTKEKRYLELSKHFIDNRGQKVEEYYPWANAKYAQDHLPVRQQTTAEGHSVRAGYLYTAMADIARYYNDKELFNACEKIFDNIVNKRMYITGGIGSSEKGEAFTIDYDLPNLTAYAESCAAIALIYFAKRMLLIDVNSKYSDIIEKILYNGFLSSISIDGKSFFYLNPLEITPKLKFKDSSVENGTTNLPITQRLELFECSCCPPNISRLLAALGDYIYSQTDDTLYIHQYMSNETTANSVSITQETNYPNDGTIKIKVKNYSGKYVAIRVPGWCEEFEIKLNGADVLCDSQKGYMYIPYAENFNLELNFKMKTELIEANPYVIENCGKVAVNRGPIVYCIEGIDNGENLKEIYLKDILNDKVVFDNYFNTNIIEIDGYRHEKYEQLYRKASNNETSQRLKLIPYFAFANRGETEMVVWILKSK